MSLMVIEFCVWDNPYLTEFCEHVLFGKEKQTFLLMNISSEQDSLCALIDSNVL